MINDKVEESKAAVVSIRLTKRKCFRCKKCSFKTFSKDNLVDHTKTCLPHNIINCPKCQFCAMDELSMKQHMYDEHVAKTSFQDVDNEVSRYFFYI